MCCYIHLYIAHHFRHYLCHYCHCCHHRCRCRYCHNFGTFWHRQAGDADAACCSSHREPAKPITWQSGWSNGAGPQPKQSGPDTPGTAGAPSSSLSPAPCHLEQQCGASASRWSSSLCLSLRSSPGPSLCFWPCPLLCPLLCPSPAVPARMKVAHRRWRSKNPMSPAMPA